MRLHNFDDSPFQLQLNFSKIIENLEQSLTDNKSENFLQNQSLLQEIAQHPELRTGITEASQITENAALISRLLTEYFSPVLTLNEIKAVSIPYSLVIFNHTKRFKNILNAAGPDFEINLRDFSDHQFYIASCCIILNEYYGTKIDFSKPLLYEIPTANGIIKYYRILYNGDFMDILPTEKTITLSQDDVDQLLNNYDDLALWKEKFPVESWALKGFAIMTLYDATAENAVSLFKEKLLGKTDTGFRQSIESIFRSIYQIPDLKVGFTVYNEQEEEFGIETFGQQLPSYILQNQFGWDSRKLFCPNSYENLIEKQTYFAVSDMAAYLAEYPESYLAGHFLSQNIQSAILAPIVKNNHLFGILEVVSSSKKAFNSINANKLEIVLPFLTETIERLVAEAQNQVQAVIQDRYTSIHNSVYWKFYNEARRHILDLQRGKDYVPHEITFSDVYPLYGQIDIKGSSEKRNSSIQMDLQKQLETLIILLQKLRNYPHLSRQFKQQEQQLNIYYTDLSTPLKASTELYITNYVEENIHTYLKEIPDPDVLPVIEEYFIETDKANGAFHTYRRKYEATISMINNKMAAIIDASQTDAQLIFPHYYERFITDGVEHNLYIGASISPKKEFNITKLHDLRLWQLQILCELEIAHQHLKPSLPYQMEVTTLILVYQSTIDIRFRMDEKRFDFDGSYNARFEIVKKRIDKACVKGTRERITQTGKLTIVYSSNIEEKEYTNYIKILQSKYLLKSQIELLEVEDLPGVSGLKALRVTISHNFTA